MKIFVCIKQVPDTETKAKIAADNKALDTSAVKWIMNPYDEYAVEESIKIRDANPGSQVFAITVGPKKRTVDALRTALAMGVDDAIAIDASESLDVNSVAVALASGIQQEGGAELILTGKLAIDDNASSVPQMLAEILKIPHVGVVSKLEKSGVQWCATRDSEGGSRELFLIDGNCLISANKGLNTPRYASLPGIMKAKKKVIKELDGAALLGGRTNKTQVLAMEMPPEKPPARLLTGDATSQVTQLVQLLRNEVKVL